jgi:Parvulin-like peptidyl-prolyl isomerase
MKKKILMVVVAICLVLTTACTSTKLKDGKEVVGKIKGKTVTAEDLYKELKTQGGTNVFMGMVDEYIANKEIKTTDAIKKEAQSQLDSLKTQYEDSGQNFEEAMQNAGYKNEKVFKDLLILDIKKGKVVENFLKDKVSDDEINDYYEKNINGEITARHVLITPDVADDAPEDEKEKAKEKAKKEAEDIVRRLNEGEKIKDLAKKYTDDEGSKESGGLIENITNDSVVEPFYNAVAELKDGKYTKEPVESSFGYHVILRVSQKEKPKLKDVKTDIIDKIVTEKMESDEEITRTTWVSIRKKYKLDIKDSEIKKGYKEATK